MAQSREDEILPAAEEQQSEGPGLECAASVHGDRVLFPCASPECVPYVVPRGIGFIESIQLENFLSYATLGPVKFGTHINFVVGHGGRSALLTALIIGLGGKSLGTSLKDFVKDGATSANISITLRNSGIYAFKSDVYGDSITVQRCISVDEGPSYKLKDQGGNHVSSEKEELTAILEHFMIQVDNPAVVLLQHVGKQFVCARNEGDRYRLFLKSTKLEHMREEYSELLAKKARSQNELDQAREEVERLGYEEAQIGKHFQSRAALREKLEDLKHEMAWALVNETEKDLNNMLIHINFGDQQAEILDQELEASRAKLNEAEQEHRSIQEHLQKLNEEGEALKPKCISARDDAESMQRAYIQVEVALNSSQDELNKLEKVAENINNKIKDTKKSLHLLELEKQRKISVLKEKLKKHREQEELLVQDIKLIHRTVEKDDEEHFRVKKEEAYVQQMLNEGQQQLIQWKEYKSDPLKRFGPYISALLEAIDGAHRQGLFTCKPIGPLGACIRLRDPEFALAVECCLKGRLLDFFCDNQQDKQALQELMTTVYPFGTPRPQIIVSSFECELYDVTERAACHPEYPTVLTALEIDKTVVSNALIDMRHIETVLLIKDNSLAHTMIQGQGLPKNCTKILTACGDEVYEGCYSSCEESRPTYLGDVDLEISNLEKEVENRIGHLSVYQQHVSELEKDMRKNRETMDSHYQYLKELRTKEVNITSQIKDLGNRNESQSKDILILEQEAQEIQGKIQEVEEKMKAQKDKMDSLRQLGIEAEQRFENYKSRCIQLSDVIDSFIEKQNELASEVGTQKESMCRCCDFNIGAFLTPLMLLDAYLIAHPILRSTSQYLLAALCSQEQLHPQRRKKTSPGYKMVA
ncbi:structural maintenance of chromosomes protein 6-like [Dromiciops gliroides]|uniref:structural maintenance of chromosomes protein 6-like n=1 Tax=Dromiciops gliroides TaxID=33562 RepID=UPI001CC37FD2|nr:structural maintenance of chromosomes protein 6-like [Dromiciops gliroides]